MPKSSSFHFLDLILKKRESASLTREEIDFFVRELDRLPDYQISAFLSFCFCRGLDAEETAHLTRAMKNSGEQVDRGKFPKEALLLDKHSTGGVGDKISIPLAPLLVAASEQIYIPMIAGRSLGHTGGTVDKLESIPGMTCLFSRTDYHRLLKKNRMLFAGQSEKVCPADRKLYALRDVTGTVPSIPLIVASILSKKLSASLDYLLLDVKFGSGAFMKTEPEAKSLAEALIQVAGLNALKAEALLTDMNSPIGQFVGNRLEIYESLLILKNEGPEDTRELTLALGERMLHQTGLSLAVARKRLEEVLQSGEAYECFERVVASQGGSLRKLETARGSKKIRQSIFKAPDSGVVSWNTEVFGLATQSLGAGRLKQGDRIDPDVGVEILRPAGEQCRAGDPLLRLYYKDASRLKWARKKFEEAWTSGQSAVSIAPRVSRFVSLN